MIATVQCSGQVLWLQEWKGYLDDNVLWIILLLPWWPFTIRRVMSRASLYFYSRNLFSLSADMAKVYNSRILDLKKNALLYVVLLRKRSKGTSGIIYRRNMRKWHDGLFLVNRSRMFKLRRFITTQGEWGVARFVQVYWIDRSVSLAVAVNWRALAKFLFLEYWGYLRSLVPRTWVVTMKMSDNNASSTCRPSADLA